MYYEEDFVEQVRQQNDIVDIISSYVNLKRGGAITLDYVRFTMKRQLPFRSVRQNRCITALVVVPAGMYLHF